MAEVSFSPITTTPITKGCAARLIGRSTIFGPGPAAGHTAYEQSPTTQTLTHYGWMKSHLNHLKDLRSSEPTITPEPHTTTDLLLMRLFVKLSNEDVRVIPFRSKLKNY